MTSRIVYYLEVALKRCTGTVEDPEGNHLFTGS